VAVLVLLFAVVVSLLGVLVAGLLRSHAEILRALHELGVGLDPDEENRPGTSGLEVPLRRASRTGSDLAGVTPGGDAISVGVVGVEHLTLVAFLTSGCSTCSAFWSAFADRRLKVPGGARLVVATKGAEAESPGRLSKFVPPQVPVVMSSEAWTDFDVPVAPYFALVDGPSGAVIGEGAASSWEHLRTIVQQALDDAGLASGRRRRRGREDREPSVDAQLLAAGLKPGDPSLYLGDDAATDADPEVERPR
jgi:hypothetical protein